ncbi:MaoC family dehydratase [Cryptosporangium phraense]|uniref:MaoC family dehydratase n=1 Tax=Cryptosporangium phraense TaxID=2593070 RepID=A0A545AL44_9ACTN|nr:MaoC family dehydratase [Cryptosporangium phraense]TQS42039.1 MaoC family dehydratase [Cryptosporangium phraense]
MRVFTSVDELEQAVGTEVGASEWLTVTQDRVDLFADATDDHQWIHVDVERAAAGPFGAPIAHGYLTLSLLPSFARQIFRVEARMAVNYGLNKVRFPAPVAVGSSIRAVVRLLEVTRVGEAVQVVSSTTVEIRGGTKPAVVAETVGRFYL